MTNVKVVFSRRFEADLDTLRKRFRQLFDDIDPLLEQLEQGQHPGDKLVGLKYDAYKVRVANSSAQRGKSGGFRVIYYVQVADQVVMLTLYSKFDQTDIPLETIRRLIAEHLENN